MSSADPSLVFVLLNSKKSGSSVLGHWNSYLYNLGHIFFFFASSSVEYFSPQLRFEFIWPLFRVELVISLTSNDAISPATAHPGRPVTHSFSHRWKPG